MAAPNAQVGRQCDNQPNDSQEATGVSPTCGLLLLFLGIVDGGVELTPLFCLSVRFLHTKERLSLEKGDSLARG